MKRRQTFIDKLSRSEENLKFEFSSILYNNYKVYLFYSLSLFPKPKETTKTNIVIYK